MHTFRNQVDKILLGDKWFPLYLVLSSSDIPILVGVSTGPSLVGKGKSIQTLGYFQSVAFDHPFFKIPSVDIVGIMSHHSS